MRVWHLWGLGFCIISGKVQRNIGKWPKPFEGWGQKGRHLANPICGPTSVAENLGKMFLKENIFSGLRGKNGSVSPFDPRPSPFSLTFPNTGYHPHGISLSSFHQTRTKVSLVQHLYSKFRNGHGMVSTYDLLVRLEKMSLTHCSVSWRRKSDFVEAS